MFNTAIQVLMEKDARRNNNNFVYRYTTRVLGKFVVFMCSFGRKTRKVIVGYLDFL